MTAPVKPKRQPKYKQKMNIVAENTVQMTCSCGWAGGKMVGKTDLSATMALAIAEYQAHTHVPKVKKPRKEEK